MENAIAQPAISERPPTADPSASANVGDIPAPTQSPPRLRSLSGLLMRENVGFVIVTGAQKMKVQIEGASKSFDMGDEWEGCYVIMALTDNPVNVGAKFYEVKPPRA